MPKYKVCKVNDFGNQVAAAFEIEGNEIAVYCVEGKFFASEDFCPHRGESLGGGNLKGFVITCPAHGWKFDIETGECFSDPDRPLQTYPVSIDGEDVYVELK